MNEWYEWLSLIVAPFMLWGVLELIRMRRERMFPIPGGNANNDVASVYHLLTILDRSGSMAVIKTDMEGGYARFIEEQKAVAGKMRVSLIQFDTEFEEVYIDKDLKEVPAMVLEPRGGTALLDAVYKAVSAVKSRIGAAKCTVMIITDGEENSSREVTLGPVKALIESMTAKGWTFVFLGANQDAFAEAGGMSIASGSTMNYKGTTKGVNVAYSNVSAAVTRSRTGEETKSGEFFEVDEQNAGGDS